MINVLSLVPYQFLPPTTGGAKSISLFNHYFSKLVHLYTVSVKNNTIPDQLGYEMLPLLSNSIFRYINPVYIFTLSRVIRQKKITHLILEHPYYGWLGFALQRFTGIKLIIHSHNIESLRFKSLGKWWWRLLWWYEKMGHHYADFNFFISQEDRDFAQAHFKLDPEKCAVITYGTIRSASPTPEEKADAKIKVSQKHNLQEGELLLLYNGALNYQPNIRGLEVILNEINPQLLQTRIAYKIIICGSHLPESYNHLEAYKTENIIYAGFVEDIDSYFLAADIFLNPISDGGGIKTKLVEALAAGGSAISFQTGALGIPKEVSEQKLIIVPDCETEAMVKAIQHTIPDLKAPMPVDFYSYFYWGNIAQKSYRCLVETI